MKEENSQRILGVEVSRDLKWKTHEHNIHSTLRQRVLMLKKLSFNLPRDCLWRIIDGLIMSTARYCIPLYGQIKTQQTSTTSAIQVQLNNAMRVALGVKRSDHVPIQELLDRTNCLSHNQMCAQATLSLTWQIQKGTCKGLERFFDKEEIPRRDTKSTARGDIRCTARTSISQNSFRYQAAKLWNIAPPEIKNLKRMTVPTEAIKAFAKSLPV